MDANNPFLHDAIVTVVRNTVFNSYGSMGHKYSDIFGSAHDDRGEPELTHALVAVVATAVFILFNIS